MSTSLDLCAFYPDEAGLDGMYLHGSISFLLRLSLKRHDLNGIARLCGDPASCKPFAPEGLDDAVERVLGR